MVLGTLNQHGPRHGHEIRRIAEVTDVVEWGGVSVGALYRELRNMEAEGLVEALRTERVGRRPARTVYAITRDGCLELALLKEQAVRTTQIPPDPLGVALSFGEDAADVDELAGWLRTRRETFALRAAELERDRNRLVAKGYLGPLRAAVMYRSQMHAETEVRWHDEFAKILAELPPEELTAGLRIPAAGPAAQDTPAGQGTGAGQDPATDRDRSARRPTRPTSRTAQDQPGPRGPMRGHRSGRDNSR
jgi:DNA-binding PadR family transcriptional regulator